MSGHVLMRSILTTCSLLLASVPTYADPIPVRAGGVAFTFGIEGIMSFDFVARDFHISSHAFNDGGEPPEFTLREFPFPAQLATGTRIDLSSLVTLQQTFTHSGLPSPLGGNFTFRAGTGSLACAEDEFNVNCTAQARFTFEGRLRSLDAPHEQFPLDVRLAGNGIASAFYQGSGDQIFAGASGVAYSFEPAVTPEPATLLLLACGVAGVAGRRQRPWRRGQLLTR